jgi:hypothetical protein
MSPLRQACLGSLCVSGAYILSTQGSKGSWKSTKCIGMRDEEIDALMVTIPSDCYRLTPYIDFRIPFGHYIFEPLAFTSPLLRSIH